MFNISFRVIPKWDNARVISTDALLQHNLMLMRGMVIPAHSNAYDMYGIQRKSHSRDAYAVGSMRDPRMYTIRNEITGEVRRDTMSNHADWMVANGWITERRNWNGSIIAQNPATHCKGWKCV